MYQIKAETAWISDQKFPIEINHAAVFEPNDKLTNAASRVQQTFAVRIHVCSVWSSSWVRLLSAAEVVVVVSVPYERQKIQTEALERKTVSWSCLFKFSAACLWIVRFAASLLLL